MAKEYEVLNNQTNSEEESDDLVKWLMASPRPVVQTWKAYDINGFCFQTKDQDEHTVVQNSGVTLVAKTTHVSSARDRNPIFVPVNYFGFIQQISRQVFYVKDPSNNNQYVVINGKQQLISGTSEEMNEDCLPVCTIVPVDTNDSEVDDEI
ncbi:unnamed protein product [Rhodiola kirilowii]